jgi:N-acetyl-anhydromuramyl-L-alanine amidase AmpD
MGLQFNEFPIPLEAGQAVSKGWTKATAGVPVGVTWHWTASYDLSVCRKALGGAQAERKGVASAHFAVGRSRAEGIDRYVALENRSWHAGINQVLRWDGKPSDAATKASRSTVGVETVNIGYARPGIPAEVDWIDVAAVDSRRVLRVQPWTEEQVEMMIELGKMIYGQFNRIGVRDHHGHHDLCPGYKDDVAGFPFARVLSGIYGVAVPDVWTPLRLPIQRQKALRLLGAMLGDTGPRHDGVDGLWGRVSDRALIEFQASNGLVPNGYWSTFVCWQIHDRLQERGIDLAAECGNIVQLLSPE